jgi:hypothetical protein
LVPAVLAPDFDSFAVRQAIAGFLAGYGDTTRDAYGLDLRQWLDGARRTTSGCLR